jgi:hypothetical protein
MPDALRTARRSLLALFGVGAVLLLTGCGGPNLIEMIQRPRWGLCGTVVIVLDIVALIDLLGDNRRSTGNKVIWTLLILFVPVLGCILYYLFGR